LFIRLRAATNANSPSAEAEAALTALLLSRVWDATLINGQVGWSFLAGLIGQIDPHQGHAD